ncbi:proteinase-activated receptor 3 [Dendropsophus ebraccatus]|uniref:proteinase-activated receptor 3 n=1 Tax=Dendropsophus ebraccatus TaxID=150705 RepID=UPI0038315DD1
MEVLLVLLLLSVTAHSINYKHLQLEKNLSEILRPRTFRLYPEITEQLNLNDLDGNLDDPSNDGASESSADHRTIKPPSVKAIEPSSGRRALEPPSRMNASKPLSRHRTSNPKLSQGKHLRAEKNQSKTEGPRTFRLYPGVTERVNDTDGNLDDTSNHGDSESPSYSETIKPPSVKDTEPSLGNNASKPSSRHSTSKPNPDQGFSKAISNDSRNLVPSKSNPLINNATLSYLRSSTSTKLIPAIYIIVILIGIPSNAIVLKMLFSRARTVCTAIFYTNLAISDLLFCLMLPFRAAYHLNGNNWIFGEGMCRITTIFFYGNMYCSILLLMCISISRYIAIAHPFIYRSLPKRTCALLMCSLVWVTVLMFMIPFFINRQTCNLRKYSIITCNDVYETSADAFQFFYFISLAVFGYLIPFTVIAFCSFSIIKTLGSSNQKWFLYLKITVLLLVIFALCFTPNNILLIIHQVRYHYTQLDDLYGSYLIALCFSSLNSCLDPFLYFLMSEMTKPTNEYVTINKLPQETQVILLAS